MNKGTPWDKTGWTDWF